MGVTVRQKEAGGPWWVFIKHRGRRKSKRVGDKNAANTLAGELCTALAANDLGMLQDDTADGLTFGTYATRYLTKVEPDTRDPEHGLKRSTWIDYAGCLNRRLIPALGERVLTSLTRRDVKDLAASLRTALLSAINIRKQSGSCPRC